MFFATNFNCDGGLSGETINRPNNFVAFSATLGPNVNKKAIYKLTSLTIPYGSNNGVKR